MLNKMPLKLASLAFGLMLVAGCQHQGAGQTDNANKPAAAPASAQGSEGDQQAAQAQQNIVTVHLAQLKEEPDLMAVQLGETDKLYALPHPVFTQADMQGLGPVTAKDGKTFVVFEMSEQGRAKLADVSEQATGHFFLISVKGQLIGVSQIGEPMTDGKLVMATESEEHAKQIIDLMR